MRTYPYEIEYYLTERDQKPFKDWLDGLRDVKARRCACAWIGRDWGTWATGKS